MTSWTRDESAERCQSTDMDTVHRTNPEIGTIDMCCDDGYTTSWCPILWNREGKEGALVTEHNTTVSPYCTLDCTASLYVPGEVVLSPSLQVFLPIVGFFHLTCVMHVVRYEERVQGCIDKRPFRNLLCLILQKRPE